MKEINIDYYQASIVIHEPKASDNRYQPHYPMQWYKRAYIDEDGVRYNFGNEKSKKALIVASGQACEWLYAKYSTTENVLAYLAADRSSISRFDIALTNYVDNDLITVSDFVEMWKNGEVESTLLDGGVKQVSSFDKDGEILPETFYLGDLEKRGKKGLFRAYDKGIQLDIGKYMITRFELEERGDKAKSSMKRILNGNSLESVMLSRVNVTNERFKRLVDAEPCKTLRGKAKEKIENEELDNTWKWLIEQVAPAIKKTIDAEKKRDVLELRLAEFIQKSGLRHTMLEGVKFMVSQELDFKD